MRIIEDIKLDFKDVLIQPKRSTLNSRREVDLTRTYTFKHSNKTWTGIPIIAANMDGVGTWEAAQVLQKYQMFTALVKSYAFESWSEHYKNVDLNHISVSTGTSDQEFEKLNLLVSGLNLKFVCIDVANGYTENFVRYVERVRSKFPDITIIAGNVVTPEMTEELILKGADVVKVGIGPGSVCTTRRQTGVGYPQLSAIIECADAAHGLGGLIVADGGCTCPGDVAKAFGAGADFVMLGGMLAGHDEGGGNRVVKYYNPMGEQFIGGTDMQGVPKYEFCATKREFVEFYGMSSGTAMEKHHGGVADYRSSEGRTVMMPYRGALETTVKDLLGGLRSACTYVGASKLKELSKRTTFVRVTQQLNPTFGNEGI
jgi:GMP reductase